MPHRSSERAGPHAAGSATRADVSQAASWPVLETVHSSLVGLMLAMMGIAPRLVPALLTLTAIVTAIEVLRSGRQPVRVLAAVLAPHPMRFAFALLAFAALTACWASDPKLTLQSVVQVGTLMLATGIIVVLLPWHLEGLPAARRNRFTRAVPIGFGIAVGFILAEFATGNAISLAVVARFPALMGDNSKDFIREGDKVLGFLPFYLDRNAAAVTLALPAALLATKAWVRNADVARLGMLGILLAAIAAISLSWSGAAKLAAVTAAIAGIAVARWPVEAVRALSALLVIGVLLALPLGHLPSKLGAETAPWLPPSARERAMIWDRTAAAARRTPMLGIGVQSTRYQAAGEPERIEGVRGQRRELGWHAHNFVLQAWLEMGAAGALLLLGFVLSILRSISGLERPTRVAAAALFAMALAVGLTGWGMWQPWLAAVMGAAVAGLCLAPSVKNE